MELGRGIHQRTIDTEEYHESPEEDMKRAMMSEFGKEELPVESHLNPLGCSIAPLGIKSGSKMEELRQLTHCKNRAGGITSSLAWDDLTGMKLEAGRVIEARAKEVTYLREKRVYDKVHRQYAMRNKWKIIKTRWIDINKGDDDNPVYRSRLVGKEFNDGHMDGLCSNPAP